MNRKKAPQMWAPQPNWTFNGNDVYCRLMSTSITDEENTTNYNIPNIRDGWIGRNDRRVKESSAQGPLSLVELIQLVYVIGRLAIVISSLYECILSIKNKD